MASMYKKVSIFSWYTPSNASVGQAAPYSDQTWKIPYKELGN
jgi:hypothetical protein